MVHLRLNENEPNPNPHVNFITALPMADAHEQERARQLLRALAAQVRPIMKSHGFVVNSLEEYEYNNVFAGRNWNNGRPLVCTFYTLIHSGSQLVLRGRDGSFVSTPWLIGTLCHEVRLLNVYTQHMNHGSDFQSLWSQLRKEVVALQAKGYYGDGMWSSGTRLTDSTKVVGSGPIEDGLPEYMCGGAQSRARPSARRRRRQPVAGPSLLTGAQTTKRRKAGSRVTTSGIFTGGGQALNADEDDKRAGTGFRKKAASKRAREERALAAERRFRTLQGDGRVISPFPLQRCRPLTNSFQASTQGSDEDDSDVDAQELRESDQDRLHAMMTSMDVSEVNELRTGTLSDFWGDFILPRHPTGDNDSDHLACTACGTPRGDTRWHRAIH
ncbi:WLM domain-containing protein [Lactifluus volemus]|nr:WLM domain-containing protein [Lactifluus volemus]